MRQSIPLVVSTLLLSYLAVAGFAARPKPVSTFEIFSNHVVSTTASPGVVAEARRQVHETLAHWVTTPDGRRSDPSFREGSEGWTSTGPTVKSPTVTLGRSTTEFDAADGKPLKLEVIAGSDMPTIVFVSYSGEGGPQAVVNAFVSSLQKQGVRLKGN